MIALSTVTILPMSNNLLDALAFSHSFASISLSDAPGRAGSGPKLHNIFSREQMLILLGPVWRPPMAGQGLFDHSKGSCARPMSFDFIAFSGKLIGAFCWFCVFLLQLVSLLLQCFRVMPKVAFSYSKSPRGSGWDSESFAKSTSGATIGGRFHATQQAGSS